MANLPSSSPGQRGAPSLINNRAPGSATNDAPGSEWALRTRLRQKPDDAAALSQLAQIVRDQGRGAEAVALYQRALQCSPTDSDMRFALVGLLQQQGDAASALEQVRLLSAEARSTSHAQLREAELLGSLGRYEEQASIYQRLLRRNGQNAQLWLHLGNALKYKGDAPGAIRAMRRSVSIRPDYGEGWWSLANMKTFKFAPKDVETMEGALRSNPSPDDALHVNFALGKALEQLKQFQRSFEHYEAGNRVRAESLSPSRRNIADLVETYVDQAIATFDRALLDKLGGSGHPGRGPIFVVGLQRSGSTLIEQILASHPLIEGTSELDAMMHIWINLEHAAAGSGRSVWEEVQQLDPQRLGDLGADYLHRVQAFRTTDRPLFTDKRPANWMYVGLIRLMFPNAAIIDARRHPMACGLSNFVQHYAGGAAFSYDLRWIGRYYSDYLRLMRHFDELEPGSIHHILNEALIDDPEGEVRRLLDFVGVPFDPACLNFDENRRVVRTASAEQVRRPINRDGVDRWRDYEPWLTPLKEALGPALDTWRFAGGGVSRSG
jgi:tetratricopeptide (TPR) repeat protein